MSIKLSPVVHWLALWFRNLYVAGSNPAVDAQGYELFGIHSGAHSVEQAEGAQMSCWRTQHFFIFFLTFFSSLYTYRHVIHDDILRVAEFIPPLKITSPIK